MPGAEVGESVITVMREMFVNNIRIDGDRLDGLYVFVVSADIEDEYQNLLFRPIQNEYPEDTYPLSFKGLRVLVNSKLPKKTIQLLKLKEQRIFNS